MSRIKEVKRQLEAASEAIEALDMDLAAGRLDIDEHARQRAEREREAGRLFVTLRRAHREGRGPEQPAATAGTRPGWFRNPLAMAAAAVLLVVVGIGGGLAVGRWFSGAPGAGVPATP